MRDITAVLGVYNNLDTTKAFMEDFIRRFPDIPISVSCVGSSQEVQDECKRLYGEKVITGTTERVSFSETWNYAIRGIKTSKFVFIHNDMYIVDDFFDQLEGYYLDSSKNFYVPFSSPAPNICSKFLKRSGYSALEVLTPEEKEKYFEIYRKLPSYNPEVSPEEFFKGMDSGFLGIYPQKKEKK